MAPRTDFYRVLGISRHAEEEDVKRAFRALAKKLHPDLNAGSASSEAAFKAANEAYAVLGDAGERRAYDAANKMAGLTGDPRLYTRGMDPDMSPAQRARASAYASATAAATAASAASASPSSASGGGGGYAAYANARPPPSRDGPRGAAGGPSSSSSSSSWKDHIDEAEWEREQFGAGGPAGASTNSSEAWRAWAEARVREGKAKGFSGANDAGETPHRNFEARRAAAAEAESWKSKVGGGGPEAGGAGRGMSESGHYRAWAAGYRANAAADAKSLPRRMVLAVVLLLGAGSVLTHSITTGATAAGASRRGGGRPEPRGLAMGGAAAAAGANGAAGGGAAGARAEAAGGRRREPAGQAL